jgi:hypothetical protein
VRKVRISFLLSNGEISEPVGGKIAHSLQKGTGMFEYNSPCS